jgi:hypothetical protein
MPSKICPSCNTAHGARKLVCECGHDFGCKHKTTPGTHDFPYPEPGKWVWVLPKGMPPIHSPDVPPGPLSASVVKEQISYEGLGFCVYSLIPPDHVADERLRELWVAARAAMREIVDYLDQVE